MPQWDELNEYPQHGETSNIIFEYNSYLESWIQLSFQVDFTSGYLSLWKHTYLKKYIENFTTQNWNFSYKNSDRWF